MHALWLLGMPRRIMAYLDQCSWENDLNSLITFGAFRDRDLDHRVPDQFRDQRRAPKTAPDDPWEGFTLEWATSRPPPAWNFDEEQEVPSLRPGLRDRLSRAQEGPGLQPLHVVLVAR